MKSRRPTGFGQRLREAFEGKTNAEIARELGVSNSTVTDYMKGKTFPTGDGLLQIAEKTKCNIHWLLTGAGEADLDPLRFLDEKTRAIVNRLTADEKKPAHHVLNELIREALMKRGSDLFLIDERRLRGRQLEQLRMLVELAAENDDGDVKEKAG